MRTKEWRNLPIEAAAVVRHTNTSGDAPSYHWLQGSFRGVAHSPREHIEECKVHFVPNMCCRPRSQNCMIQVTATF
jgi:hypothetical protein